MSTYETEDLGERTAVTVVIVFMIALALLILPFFDFFGSAPTVPRTTTNDVAAPTIFHDAAEHGK
ncbi:MAG: hypothetical protein QM669_15465 [Siphonobacter sp.]